MCKKRQLKIEKVKLEDLEQYNQLLRYVFQVTHRDLQNIGWEEKEIIRAKSPILEQADVLGWFDGDKLVSHVSVYPFQVRIFNKTYDMGGLTGVGTYPEYSNQGLMHKLLYKALENMRKRNQSISYLYPYSIPYYRRKGWEIISDKITFEINDYQLPKNKQVPGGVERVDVESEQIKKAYERFALQTHGAMLRNDLAWNEYYRWDSDDLMAAVYYNDERQPNAYLLYWIADDIFHIKDMIFVNEEARSGLWNFISAHFSMISKVIGNTYTDEPLAFLLEDGDIEETISPYYMARIVDLEQFIAQYPFRPDTADREWTFILDDPLLSWNQGIFTLRITSEGIGEVIRTSKRSSDKIDIQTMTTMLLGYKRPDYLHKIGRISCGPETIDMLEDAIEQQTPYFSDYF
ncbi:GNAT family N-acetyltransferase [Clostridium botulinum]|uniref:GNAT family N-acetyltransferase n=1 Tax=Clostridium botulinum TaxID=1491 RepID=UPI000773E9B8|nr:GNAT family N-acetyltransferase [Clostridium botulinum]AUM91532.1 GNAT family N-acetyltransferase [Clostridium botulinum]NFB12932.1 GNAT family N-acetyltransferase [Clostridium botulinum]NFH57862.1 GNAT family N-acetyltransferase [Clostridium botulinum]NFJ87265.1 GNAT family N-acetyltransferase [Clostridium botulinum]NFV28498.1 GNAT family N-acetyltransferase [Clostridium botulinum]